MLLISFGIILSQPTYDNSNQQSISLQSDCSISEQRNVSTLTALLSDYSTVCCIILQTIFKLGIGLCMRLLCSSIMHAFEQCSKNHYVFKKMPIILKIMPLKLCKFIALLDHQTANQYPANMSTTEMYSYIKNL